MALNISIAEISDFLKYRKQATLADFVNHFRNGKDAIEGILEQYVALGLLRKESFSNCCGSGCDVCDTSMSEMYGIID